MNQPTWRENLNHSYFMGKDCPRPSIKYGPPHPTCLFNNLQEAIKPLLAQPAQHKESYPGKTWQIKFTQMPPNKEINAC